jgi:hypothetical protein
MQEILDNIPPIPVSRPAIMDAHENEPQKQFQLGVDPAGDIFRDYANYDYNFSIDAEEDQDMDEPSTDEDELDGLAET